MTVMFPVMDTRMMREYAIAHKATWEREKKDLENELAHDITCKLYKKNNNHIFFRWSYIF